MTLHLIRVEYNNYSVLNSNLKSTGAEELYNKYVLTSAY